MPRPYRNPFSPNGKTGRAIWERDSGKCIYCGSPASVIDHVIPEKFDGRAVYSNGVCACYSCNNYKGKHPEDLTFIEQAYRYLHQCGVELSVAEVELETREPVRDFYRRKRPQCVSTKCEHCGIDFIYTVKKPLTSGQEVRRFCKNCVGLSHGRKESAA